MPVGDLASLGHGHRRVQEVHVGARQHGVAHLPAARGEHLPHDAPLLVTEVLVGGDQLAELVAGHLIARRGRVGPQQPQQHVGRLRQQPDQRAEHRGQPVQQGPSSRATPRPFCRAYRRGVSSLITSARKVTTRVISTRRGSRRSHVTPSPRPRTGRPAAPRGWPSVGGREEAGHDRPDLHRGQVAAGITGQPDHPGSAFALRGDVAQLPGT